VTQGEARGERVARTSYRVTERLSSMAGPSGGSLECAGNGGEPRALQFVRNNVRQPVHGRAVTWDEGIGQGSDSSRDSH
jgi:hypothetical protein